MITRCSPTTHFDDDGQRSPDLGCGDRRVAEITPLSLVFDPALHGRGGQVHGLGDLALRQGVVPLQQVEDGAVEAVEHGAWPWREVARTGCQLSRARRWRNRLCACRPHDLRRCCRRWRWARSPRWPSAPPTQNPVPADRRPGHQRCAWASRRCCCCCSGGRGAGRPAARTRSPSCATGSPWA